MGQIIVDTSCKKKYIEKLQSKRVCFYHDKDSREEEMRKILNGPEVMTIGGSFLGSLLRHRKGKNVEKD